MQSRHVLDAATVHDVIRLAHLDFATLDPNRLVSDLAKILAFMERIHAVDTTGAPLSASPLPFLDL